MREKERENNRSRERERERERERGRAREGGRSEQPPRGLCAGPLDRSRISTFHDGPHAEASMHTPRVGGLNCPTGALLD